MPEWVEFDGTGYLVSRLGQVRGPKGNILKPRSNGNGYLRVSLGSKREEYIHRMVLICFHRPPRAGEESDHKNKSRGDNRITNLRWLKKKANLARRNIRRGMQHHFSKLNPEQVSMIRGGPFYRGRDQKLAAALGVSRETVRDVRLGYQWK